MLPNRHWAAAEKSLTQPLRARKSTQWILSEDLFHESVPDAWIDRVFAVAALCPQHTLQVLTKRSARMRAYLSAAGVVRRIYTAVDKLRYSECPNPDRRHRAFHRWMAASARDTAWLHQGGAASDMFKRNEPGRAYPSWVRWPLPNVWLGVSAEDQTRADERVPDLLATPAAVRFVSAEPLLGAINFADAGASTAIDWIIVGGESGPKARPMHPAWARSIRDQCEAAGVAFHFKQHGAWVPEARGSDWMILSRDGDLDIPDDRSPNEEAGEVAVTRVGKSRAGRLLDGVEHNGMPVPDPRPVCNSNGGRG